jgi:adenylate cyclase
MCRLIIRHPGSRLKIGSPFWEEALAEPRGICLGGSAHEQVRDKLDLAFEDMGEQQVKNITRPVRVYRIPLGEAATAASPTAALALSDKPSIAVLPFQNMSGDPEQEYFADGMVEEATGRSPGPRLRPARWAVSRRSG